MSEKTGAGCSKTERQGVWRWLGAGTGLYTQGLAPRAPDRTVTLSKKKKCPLRKKNVATTRTKKV